MNERASAQEQIKVQSFVKTQNIIKDSTVRGAKNHSHLTFDVIWASKHLLTLVTSGLGQKRFHLLTKESVNAETPTWF